MGLFKKLTKNIGSIVSPLTGFGTLFDKMNGGGGGGYGPGPAVDPSLYKNYNDLYNNMPEEMADPETFYTPEIQQAVLDQLAQGANEQNAQDQAAISGGAIRSGFGVGSTSREAGRRAKADANALDTIINGTVQQAANLQAMRTQQAQDYAAKKQEAEQQKLNDEQKFRLSKQGYAQNELNTANAISDKARADRQQLLFGGINAVSGGLGAAAGSGFFNRPQPQNYAPGQPLFGPIASPYADQGKLSLYSNQYDYLGRKLSPNG